MREIIFDTETTGLDPTDGHRVTEIGCVEVHDLIPTGRTFQRYLNPERLIEAGAAAITGHTNEMLADKPVFAEVADDFLAFIGEATLVAHNAEFDRGFINMELERAGRPTLPAERFKDTIVLARERFPGAPASLDALCRRFGISLEERTLHGALLDAHLLAEVYLELNGGRERRLDLAGFETSRQRVEFPTRAPRPEPLASRASEAERAAHAAFLETLPGESLWKRLGLV